LCKGRQNMRAIKEENGGGRKDTCAGVDRNKRSTKGERNEQSKDAGQDESVNLQKGAGD